MILWTVSALSLYPLKGDSGWCFSSPSVSGSGPRRKSLPEERPLVSLHLFLHNYPASNQTGGDRSHGRDSNPLRLLDDVNPITRDSAIFLAMPLRYLHLGGYGWNSLMWHLAGRNFAPPCLFYPLLEKKKKRTNSGAKYVPVTLKAITKKPCSSGYSAEGVLKG